VYCFKKNISSTDFNSLKDEYKQRIKTKKDNVTLEFNVRQKTRKKHTLSLLNDIFTTAWLLSGSNNGSNGTISFTSLLGDIRKKERLLNFSGFSYRVSAPKKIERANNLSEAWLAVWDVNTLGFKSYILETCENKFYITLPNRVSFGTNILSIYWKDIEDGLCGPVLGPLFFEGLPRRFNITWPIHEIKWPPSETKFTDEIKSISHKDELLQIIGPTDLLERVKKEIYGKNYLSKIYYDSEIMGWDTEGTKILKPEEYRLITEAEEKEIVVVTTPGDENKIKILTNVKLDNKGQLTEGVTNEISYYEILEKELLKQDKKRYLIWLNYQTGECFLFGEPFKKGVKIRQKYRCLIIYFLINPRCCTFKEIYEVYKGKKYHYTETRFCKKSTRKIIEVLNEYTNKELKNYSIGCGELNFGIDAKKHPWCIINYESPINVVSSQYQFP
jgi:hypothetical protein